MRLLCLEVISWHILFQSTHPSRSATLYDLRLAPGQKSFNPHTPRGVRLLRQLPMHHVFRFNPHTPRGVRPLYLTQSMIQQRFNPHTPRGVRPIPVLLCLREHSFNPHTPRGVRRVYPRRKEQSEWFQSTHPSRSATHRIQPYRLICKFQSTHPSRSATGHRRSKSRNKSFNPHTPRGVRLTNQ